MWRIGRLQWQRISLRRCPMTVRLFLGYSAADQKPLSSKSASIDENSITKGGDPSSLPIKTESFPWAWRDGERCVLHAPRNTLVLAHGLFGFDKLGPESLPWIQVQYWKTPLESFREMGCRIIIAKVPATGSVEERAHALHEMLTNSLDRGQKINIIGHSMGGLDARYLISKIRPKEYTPVSLTTITTPHRGSAFMDYLNGHFGLGYFDEKSVITNTENDSNLLSKNHDPNNEKTESQADSNRTVLSKLLDYPAYSNLTTSFLKNQFNPNVLDVPNVRYFSFGASYKVSPLHFLHIPQRIITAVDGPENDGLVTVDSARWGQYIDTLKCDHWAIRGRSFIKPSFECRLFYKCLATFLYNQGL